MVGDAGAQRIGKIGTKLVAFSSGVGAPGYNTNRNCRSSIAGRAEAGPLGTKLVAISSGVGAPGYSGIGCKELLAHILGEASLEEACELWYRNTRAYAKRQLTWFGSDPEIRWFNPDQAEEMAGVLGEFFG